MMTGVCIGDAVYIYSINTYIHIGTVCRYLHTGMTQFTYTYTYTYGLCIVLRVIDIDLWVDI